MNENRNQRIQKLFLHALDMPAAERETWLRSECGDDQAMVGEVLDLLRHDQPTADPLERGLDGELLGEAGLYQRPDQSGLHVRCPHCHHPIELVDDAELSDVECESCGSSFSLIAADETKSYSTDKTTKIAHFDLIERVGIGAFGSVFKARDKKLDRIVAVKVPRKGQLSGDEVEKFLREARTAAQLKHPNIVAVHEVGREDNRVFIVSDFVEGVTLSDWLTGLQPTPQETAELCITIARALQYAHEHGVIHRDLKPGNIMLDRNNQPFLMDFGLAKREAAEITMTTEGQVLGTPAYMSPEQARGDAHAVDGTTDIYAVGVILFEMLTGERPFRGNLRMLLHQVLTEEAPSPRKYNASIPKDLETVCLKCLEKTPARRYGNADDLAEDLQRFIEHKPIDARPITRIERGWRWCKRKPAIASLVALLFLAMGIGTAVSSYFAVDANLKAQDLSSALVKERELVVEKGRLVDEKQGLIFKLRVANEAKSIANSEAIAHRDESEKVLNFFLGKVLAAARPEGVEGGLGNAISLQDAIDQAEPLVGEYFAGKPRAQAAVRHSLGVTYLFAGQHEKAITQLENARSSRAKMFGLAYQDTLASMYSLAEAYYEAANYPKASELRAKTLQIRTETLGINHPDTLESMLSMSKEKESRADEKSLLLSVYERCEENLGKDHALTIKAMMAISYFDARDGNYESCVKISKSVLETCRQSFGEDNPQTIDAMRHLANLYRLYSWRGGGKHHLEDARILFAKVLERDQLRYGIGHRKTCETLKHLGGTNFRLGYREDGMAMIEEAFDTAKNSLGMQDAMTLFLKSEYGFYLSLSGQTEKSIEILEETWEDESKLHGRFKYLDNLETLEHLGEAYQKAGRLKESIEVLTRVVDHREIRLGAEHVETRVAVNILRKSLWLNSQFTDILLLDQQEIEYQRQKSPHSNQLALALEMYGNALLKLQEYDVATTALQEALEIRETRSPKVWVLNNTKYLLGCALAGQNRRAEAEPLLLAGYQGIYQDKSENPFEQRKIYPAGLDSEIAKMEYFVSFYDSWEKPDKSKRWRNDLDTIKEADALAGQLDQINSQEQVKAALELSLNASKLLGQQPNYRLRRDLFARSLQWEKSLTANESTPNGTENWQQLALLYVAGRHNDFKLARTKFLTSDLSSANASHCYHSLLAALLLPLKDTDHDSVRFLAERVFQGTKDWEKQMAASAMYRLGEFDQWMEKLPEDSPMKEKNHFQRACSNFQSEPSEQNRRALKQHVERELNKAKTQIKDGVLPRHWHNYVQRIGWIEEGKRLLSLNEKNGSD